jgi:thiol-disulfide isomerase/thioredoxin
MNTTIRLLLINLVCCSGLTAQQVTHVYKTGELLGRLRHTDTTYVVNFWATWCKPCVQEMPSLDSLHAQNLDQPLKVLLVSLDFADQLERVNAFLANNKLQAECVLLDEVNGNEFVDKVHPSWSGAIPATLFLHDGKKKIVERKMDLRELMRHAGEMK